MSKISSIKIDLYQRERFDIIHFFHVLTIHGWGIYFKNQVSYLPVGDRDEYNWQSGNLSYEEFLTLVEEKYEKKETVGVILYWQESDIGIEAMIHKDTTIDFCANINRKYLQIDDKVSITDINWYMERTLGVLLKAGYLVECYEFSEF